MDLGQPMPPQNPCRIKFVTAITLLIDLGCVVLWSQVSDTPIMNMAAWPQTLQRNVTRPMTHAECDLGKDKDGIPQVAKNVRVQVEELDKHLTNLRQEFGAAHQKLKDGLKLITDPEDKFATEMPKEFESGQDELNKLVSRKDAVLEQFKALLVKYRAQTYRGDAVVVNGQMQDENPKEKMTSEAWCNIWDELFVAEQRRLSFNAKIPKEELEPRFCKDATISVESLEILWGIETAKTTKAKKAASPGMHSSKPKAS